MVLFEPNRDNPVFSLFLQPGLRVKGHGVFPDLKAQLGNAIAIDQYLSDILVGHYFLTFLDINFLQSRVNGEILSMTNNDGTSDGRKYRYRPYFTFKNALDFFPQLGLNVDAVILQDNSFEHRVVLSSELLGDKA